MKKLISKLKESTNYLSNLMEKDDMEYIDVSLQDQKIAKIFESVADDLAQKVIDYNYSSEIGNHPFLTCDEKLSKKLGLGEVTVCPYVGTVHYVWLKSNFIWQTYNDKDCLIIDLYYMDTNKDKEYVKNLILLELYNFKRDAKWVVDDVYEKKMQEMKDYLNKEIEDITENLF